MLPRFRLTLVNRLMRLLYLLARMAGASTAGARAHIDIAFQF